MEIWWTTIGFQKPYELESRSSLEDALAKAQVEMDADPEAPCVVVEITNQKGDKYPKAKIYKEYNGGIDWVREAVEANKPTVH